MSQLKLLIARADFAPYVAISELGSDDKVLHPHILNAQNIDIAMVLKLPFWTDLLKNSEEENYRKLLNGCEWTSAANEVVYFNGLRPAIVWYAVARMRRNANAVSGPFGIVQKTSEFSTPVSSTTIDKMVNEAKAAGYEYLSNVIDFLNANKADYPKWIQNCESAMATKRSQIFTPISRLDQE